MMILAKKDQTIIQALNMCIFIGQKKYGIWGDFSEKFQVLCKNTDEVTRFDGIFMKSYHAKDRKRKLHMLGNTKKGQTLDTHWIDQNKRKRKADCYGQAKKTAIAKGRRRTPEIHRKDKKESRKCAGKTNKNAGLAQKKQIRTPEIHRKDKKKAGNEQERQIIKNAGLAQKRKK